MMYFKTLYKKGVMIVGLAVIFAAMLPLNAYSDVLINEILANGIIEHDSEWLELYNNESSQISLTNFNISEAHSKNLTLNITIPSNGFIVLVENFTLFNTTFPNVNQSGIKIIEYGELVPNFELSNTKGSVALYNSTGNNVDKIEYAQSASQENISIARYPDGSSNIFNITTLTPGAKNDNQIPKLNKWHNPSSNDTNIAGLTNLSVNITDDTTQVNAVISFNGTNFSMSKNGDIFFFLWNTSLNIQRQYNITIFFNDSYGRTNNEILFNITINNSPFIVSFSPLNLTQNIAENSTLSFNVNASDPDGNLLAYSWFIDDVLNSTASVNFSYRPGFSDNGTHAINVTISDSQNQVSKKWAVIVADVNRAPILSIGTGDITVSETQKVNIAINASDGDNDTLSFGINDSRFSLSGINYIWNTNLSDSGVYTVNVTVSDTRLTDSKVMTAVILDARDLDNDGNPDFNETDDDNDGIEDESDYLTGNLSSINTTVPINLTINGTFNISRILNGTFVINITIGSYPIMEFNFTFNSSSVLDFGNLTINRTTNGSSAVSIRGLNLFNSAKTIFLERINATAKAVCIKDADASFETISSTCGGANETLIKCDNSTSGKYTCFDAGTRYKITGLSHSAVKEQCIDNDGDGYGTGCAAGADCDDNDKSKTACPGNSFSSEVSGGGGGGVTCISNWQCDSWSDCSDGLKNRNCLDKNQCAFPAYKPTESMACVVEEKNERSVNPAKVSEYKDSMIRQGSYAPNDFSRVTGHVVEAQPNKIPNLDVFFASIVFLAIVAIYFMRKRHIGG